jgi:murein L,D-transpeptidase YafK
MARKRLILFVAVVAASLLLLVAGWWWTHRGVIPNPSFTLPQVDLLVVEKSKRRMMAYSHGKLVHTFSDIQLGDAPVGHKQFEGDEKTPEGRYTIDSRNPRSRYHLSLHISYPDAAARSFAAAQRRKPGGDIFIHGQPNSLPLGRMSGDWTDGCIAVSNDEIEALWLAVNDGTPIEIRP